ncbi:MAG: TIR domain-containing protein [Fimbriimonas sp.]
MSGEERYDAFLSYARVDDETAVLGAKGDVSQFHAVLELELRKHGKRDLKIFIDREIRSGLRWRDVLEKQLNEANFMVCMLSPSFFKSTECRAEVKYFGERARAAGHKPKLHPVVIQDLSGVPQDEFFAEMLDHQLVDFTEIKLEAPNSKTYRQFVMAFAKQIHASADKVVPMVPTMDSMRRELAAAEQDRADLTERVAELTARLSQSTDEVPELREARDQLAQDLENARSISLAQAREIEKLKRLLSAPSPPSPDVTRLQNELASLHSDRERLTADLARSADSL